MADQERPVGVERCDERHDVRADDIRARRHEEVPGRDDEGLTKEAGRGRGEAEGARDAASPRAKRICTRARLKRRRNLRDGVYLRKDLGV